MAALPVPLNLDAMLVPKRTDFATWSRANLEAFARDAADENLMLRADLRAALDAYRREVSARD